MDFRYWDTLAAPEKFLEGDWQNPSRQWAGQKIAQAVAEGACTMVEVGPGNGVDYERQFNKTDGLLYTGYEGSSNLCASLRRRYPEAHWVQQPLLSLPSQFFDVVYARHILEHQPSLEPSLSHLLNAATKCAIIIWYRPPGVEDHTVGAAGEHYWTFRRSDVLDSVARAGWCIAEEQVLPGDGNLGWVLRRQA